MITMTDKRTGAVRTITLDTALGYLGCNERSSHRDNVAAHLLAGTTYHLTNFSFTVAPNPPVTLCITGCRLSADPAICVHTNPLQARKAPACGVCGAPAGTSGFVPEVEPVSWAHLNAATGSPERMEAETHALELCTACWAYSLEQRSTPEGEREALQALVERTGRGELQELAFADALTACLVGAPGALRLAVPA